MAVTDGAARSSSSTQVDPASSASVWESVLSDGIAATGIDPNATLEQADDPAASTPQGASDGLSGGAGASGSPLAPTESATGDDGEPTASPVPDPSTPTPEPSGAASEPTDPLAGAEPFTYTVDGESRTMEGAFRIPGEGLYVPEDRVPQFQLMASRADTLERQNRELYDRSQTLERLTRWDTRDEHGNVTTLTGREGLEAQRSVLARALAERTVLDKVLTDPATLAAIVDLQQDAEGNIFIVPNAREVENLRTRAENLAIKSDQRARSHLSTLAAPPPPPEPTVQDVAIPTVEQIIKDYQITGLTDADKKFLAAQLEPYVETTPQGRQVRAQFVELVKDRAALRAEAKKVATAAESAGKFNGGMQRGRQAARPPAPVVTPPAAPAQPKKVGKAEQWDSVLQTALQEIVPA